MKKNIHINILRIVFFGAIIFVFVAPLLRLFGMSFLSGESFSLSNYSELLSQERTKEAIINTIIVSLSSTAIAVFLGTTIAYIVAYTDIRFKKIIEILTISPTVIPAYIITLSWSTFLSNKGFVNETLMSLGLNPLNVYSMWGIIITLAICSTPIVYLLLITTLRKLPKDLEFASMTSGYSLGHTMLTINFKQALPSILSGAILAFLSSIDNFSIPAFLGTSAGIPVLSTYIYENVIGFGPNAFNLAASLSVMLSFFAIGGTLFQYYFSRKTTLSESIKEDFSVRIPLKKWKRFIEVCLIGFLVLINIVPILSMLVSSVQVGYADSFLEKLSLENYIFVFTNRGVKQSFINSFTLAFLSCFLCIVIGLFIAYQKVRHGGKLIKIIETCISSTYAVPGIVLALSMIFHWAKVPNVYGTVKILLISYVTRYLILQIKGCTIAVLAVDKNLEEASHVSGRSKWTMWFKVLVPMMRKQVLSSSFLIFIASLTELSLSSLLASAGTKTIGLTIFNLQQGGDYNSSIAISSTLVLLILLAYVVQLCCGKIKTKKKEIL